MGITEEKTTVKSKQKTTLTDTNVTLSEPILLILPT